MRMLDFFLLCRKCKQTVLIGLVAGSACWHVLFITLITKDGAEF
jgi:hypothetical protein